MSAHEAVADVVNAVRYGAVHSYGEPRYRAEWGDGSTLVIDFNGDTWHFGGLRLVTGQQQGLYTALCEQLPDLARERGVRRFTFSAYEPEGLRRLLRRGDWHQSGLHEWEWVL